MRFQKYPASCGRSLNLLCRNGEGATTMITQMSWTHDGTLGARDFSSAVSGFCQVFIVTRAKRFFSRLRRSWLRPTAEDVSAFGQHWKLPPHARKTSGTQGIMMAMTRRTAKRYQVRLAKQQRFFVHFFAVTRIQTIKKWLKFVTMCKIFDGKKAKSKR